FEVESDPVRKFKVRSGAQLVEVLGTVFNLSAYPDEPTTQTTLVEGTVRLLSSEDNQLELAPGEQGTFAGGDFKKETVDTDQYTSWKDGVYVLNNGDLHQLIRQLERWYDVEFVLDDQLQRPVSGIISRDAKLS